MKIGDKINIKCMSNLGTGGVDTITNIKTKYFEDTGDSYKVICFGNKEFSGISGTALTPPMSYFIDIK